MKPEWAERAGRLPPSNYRRYLVGSGWTLSAEKKRSWVYACDHPQGHVTVEVPRTGDYVDYERRVVEVLEVISLVEQRSSASILFDLGHPAADKVAFGIISPETEQGTISINDSCRIRDAQRRLFLAAAHSVIEPLVHHPRLSRAEAVAFVDSCREAPAQKGSYIAPVLVPVTPAVGQLPLDDPFPRRVTRLLAGALTEVASAVASGEDQRLLEGSHKGLSSNLLDALSCLGPPGSGVLDVSFSWAPGRRAPLGRSRVRFDHRLFAPMAEAARVLKETSPAPGTTIEGYVASFDRMAQDASQPGEIALLTSLEDRPGPIKVYVQLPPEIYQQQAWEAHRGATRVRITGTLVKQGRRYVLQRPGDLVTLPDDDGSSSE